MKKERSTGLLVFFFIVLLFFLQTSAFCGLVPAPAAGPSAEDKKATPDDTPKNVAPTLVDINSHINQR
ncbi:MAG: hypothetical protein DSY57_01285, partial [Desulfobulbus sp.]